MRKLTTEIQGISIASIRRGLRYGLEEFRQASHDTTLDVSSRGTPELLTIPVRALEDFLTDRVVTVLLDVRAYEDGVLPWHESVALLTLAKLASPSAVLEIGTYMGFTTRALAQNLPGAVIHTLDLPLDFKPETDPAPGLPKDDFHLIAHRGPGREFIGTPEAARIRQHFGDSATWDFSQITGTTCFFIDGSHTYEYCKLDSEKCFALCGGKGAFFWHDCDDGHPGVVRFIGEWRKLGRKIVRLRDTALAYWDNR